MTIITTIVPFCYNWFWDLRTRIQLPDVTEMLHTSQMWQVAAYAAQYRSLQLVARLVSQCSSCDYGPTFQVSAWAGMHILLVVHPALLLVALLGLVPVSTSRAAALVMSNGGMPVPHTAGACNARHVLLLRIEPSL